MSAYIPVAAKRYVLRTYRQTVHVAELKTRAEAMYMIVEMLAYDLARQVDHSGTVPTQALDRYRAVNHYYQRLCHKRWARYWNDPGDHGHPAGVRDGARMDGLVSR